MAEVKAKAAVKKAVKTVKQIKVKPAVKAVKKTVAVSKKETVKVKEAVKESTLKQSVFDTKGTISETISLPSEIFGVKINTPLMTQAVRVYLANQRRGTVRTKSRGEVKISTRKIYRQKGTGRARHGAASAPIFVGGGIAFGPKQRDYSLKLTQKSKTVSLFSALTSKLKSGELKIVKGFEKLEPKTKNMAKSFSSLDLTGSILLVTPKEIKGFENVSKSARNIKSTTIMPANLLNTYEVLKSKNLVLMLGAVESLKETFIKK